MMRLTSSLEYSRQTLKGVFSDCEENTEKLKVAAMTTEYEAANLVSLALNFSLDDIQTYASKAGLNSTKLGFDLFPIVRNALLKAALRTLEHE